jgi:ribosomal protein S18 acetylase RimI-like enzyme
MAVVTIPVAKRELSDTDKAEIRALEDVCNQVDGIRVKLNWGLMNSRDPKKISDFCCYRDGELIGYMPLDGFGDEYEITGIVRPDCRQQGVFKTLYDAAREEAQKQDAKQLLLVNYRASKSGNAVVKALGLAYKFSEYRMEADADTLPVLPVSELRLQDAVGNADMTELSRLLGVNFGASDWNSAESLLGERSREDSRYFLVKREDICIGHVGVIVEGGSGGVYIRAVGIVPEWRHRGYGRQLLSTVVQKMLAEGHTRFELDVATENNQALSLYQSCGFHETNVYDYYVVPLINSS